MSEDQSELRPFSPEALWSDDEEEVITDITEINRYAKGARTKLQNLPVYRDTSPITDTNGNTYRQFEHTGKAFLIYENRPPQDAPNLFNIVVMETATPVEVQDGKIDLDKHPDLKQYSVGLESISYSSPTIGDTNSFAQDTDYRMRDFENTRPVQFDPTIDKKENLMPKMNKKGVIKQIDKLLSRLGSPRIDLKPAI